MADDPAYFGHCVYFSASIFTPPPTFFFYFCKSITGHHRPAARASASCVRCAVGSQRSIRRVLLAGRLSVNGAWEQTPLCAVPGSSQQGGCVYKLSPPAMPSLVFRSFSASLAPPCFHLNSIKTTHNHIHRACVY